MARRIDLDLEFMPLFVDHFLDATMTWPAARVGAYLRLLLFQWKRGAVPGDDLEELSRIVGELDLEVAKLLWDRLQIKFPNGEHGYQNAKLEEVRAGVLRRMKGNQKRTKAATKAAAQTKRSQEDTAVENSDGSVTDPVTDTVTESVTDSLTDDKLRNLETLKSGNTYPPQPARRAGVVSLSDEMRLVIERILLSLTVDECATAERFHRALVRHFEALGWSVENEVRVPNRGDGRAGYVDCIVSAPHRIAFEFDRNMPRDKSIEKLLTLADDGYAPVVLCRAAPAAGWWVERRGVEVWGLGEEPEPQFSSHRRTH